MPVYVSPPQLAKRYGVACEKVITWIVTGELAALNLATSATGRPRYKITAEAVADFERRRSVLAPPPRVKHRRKATMPAKEYV